LGVFPKIENSPEASIMQKTPKPEPSKPSKLGPETNFEGFEGSSLKLDPEERVFPHCPRCASYALYRKNNQGDFECCTCGLEGISEVAARRDLTIFRMM
jgi:hypothetical protein